VLAFFNNVFVTKIIISIKTSTMNYIGWTFSSYSKIFNKMLDNSNSTY